MHLKFLLTGTIYSNLHLFIPHFKKTRIRFNIGNRGGRGQNNLESLLSKGRRHSTAVAFSLRTQPARVRIMALEFFSEKTSDAAVLVDCALLRASGVCKSLI